MFSDEAVFYLDGGINSHNCSHFCRTTPPPPHWTIDISLNSMKVMVWAAVGVPGIIGPFFIEENVSCETYIDLLIEEFYPAFSSYSNASELHLMQDGAPPHWSQRVGTVSIRTWLTVATSFT